MEGKQQYDTPFLVNEPNRTYQRTLKRFESFEEMNEADAKEMAIISPINHLQNATMLIRKIFAEQLKQPMNKKVILVSKKYSHDKKNAMQLFLNIERSESEGKSAHVL